jgi:hypothetical protein
MHSASPGRHHHLHDRPCIIRRVMVIITGIIMDTIMGIITHTITTDIIMRHITIIAGHRIRLCRRDHLCRRILPDRHHIPDS